MLLPMPLFLLVPLMLLMALVHKLTLSPVHLYLPLLPPLLWC